MIMCSPYALLIYVDGSALKNPGKEVGLGGIAVFPEHMDRAPEKIFFVGYDGGTNQTMELRACIEALKYIRRNADEIGVNHAIIITDSQYVYDNQNRVDFWKKNRWRNASDKPVDNYRIWNEFYIVRSKVGIRTEIKWKKGKQSQVLRDVDRLAKSAAAGLVRQTDFSYMRGKLGKRSSRSAKSCLPFPAAGQVELIRVYSKKDVSTPGTKESKVKFEVFLNALGEFRDAFFAYIPDASGLHRHHCYQARFNDDSKYQQILGFAEVECPNKKNPQKVDEEFVPAD